MASKATVMPIIQINAWTIVRHRLHNGFWSVERHGKLIRGFKVIGIYLSK